MPTPERCPESVQLAPCEAPAPNPAELRDGGGACAACGDPARLGGPVAWQSGRSGPDGREVGFASRSGFLRFEVRPLRWPESSEPWIEWREGWAADYGSGDFPPNSGPFGRRPLLDRLDPAPLVVCTWHLAMGPPPPKNGWPNRPLRRLRLRLPCDAGRCPECGTMPAR